MLCTAGCPTAALWRWTTFTAATRASSPSPCRASSSRTLAGPDPGPSCGAVTRAGDPEPLNASHEGQAPQAHLRHARSRPGTGGLSVPPARQGRGALGIDWGMRRGARSAGRSRRRGVYCPHETAVRRAPCGVRRASRAPPVLAARAPRLPRAAHHMRDEGREGGRNMGKK